LDGENLGGMREVDITGQLGAGPDVPNFQTAMAFIDRGVLRGEKTPISDRRYLDGAWVDCL
jgi:hypothetical protein